VSLGVFTGFVGLLDLDWTIDNLVIAVTPVANIVSAEYLARNDLLRGLEVIEVPLALVSAALHLLEWSRTRFSLLGAVGEVEMLILGRVGTVEMLCGVVPFWCWSVFLLRIKKPGWCKVLAGADLWSNYFCLGRGC
jgi:hypothetical protein